MSPDIFEVSGRAGEGKTSRSCLGRLILGLHVCNELIEIEWLGRAALLALYECRAQRSESGLPLLQEAQRRADHIAGAAVAGIVDLSLDEAIEMLADAERGVFALQNSAIPNFSTIDNASPAVDPAQPRTPCASFSYSGRAPARPALYRPHHSSLTGPLVVDPQSMAAHSSAPRKGRAAAHSPRCAHYRRPRARTRFNYNIGTQSLMGFCPTTGFQNGFFLPFSRLPNLDAKTGFNFGS